MEASSLTKAERDCRSFSLNAGNFLATQGLGKFADEAYKMRWLGEMFPIAEVKMTPILEFRGEEHSTTETDWTLDEQHSVEPS